MFLFYTITAGNFFFTLYFSTIQCLITTPYFVAYYVSAGQKLLFLPIPLPLFPPPSQVYRRGQPGACPVLQCVEYLDVDEETAEERETKLSEDGDETKTNPIVPSPVFSAQLHSFNHLPLKIFVSNG